MRFPAVEGGVLVGRAWVWLFLSGVLLVLPAGVAGAQGASGDQYANPETDASKMPSLEQRVERQDEALVRKIGEISAIGRDLREAQSSADGSRARADDLRRQREELERKISTQREAFGDARARYEEQARAAYEGDDLEGLAALFGRWMGSGGAVGAVDPGVARVLTDGRQDLEAYERSRQTLRQTLRQISQKERDYGEAVREREASAEELRRRERALDESIAELRTDRDRSSDRLRELEGAERERILKDRAASGGWHAGGYADGRQDLDGTRSGIVAREVGPLPKRRYMELYKEAAKEYGFRRDWYVLAAVGQVESNHGENMGPSSAGAMGPMQFIPSTWETSGVDGNGDGEANVLDPRDAIPAAAGYLKVGGAPKDWYAALFSYNHADWYVKDVLAVAEAYRRLAEDDRVEPYT